MESWSVQVSVERAGNAQQKRAEGDSLTIRFSYDGNDAEDAKPRESAIASLVSFAKPLIEEQLLRFGESVICDDNKITLRSYSGPQAFVFETLSV